MNPRAFSAPGRFRAWLERNHDRVLELVVRCYKVHAAARGITYRQALDEALCFGWIDGVRRAIDADSFSVRFSPRKARSPWSRINVARAGELIRTGRMAAPGVAALRARLPERAGAHSHERALKLSPGLEQSFRAAKRAWDWFQAQPPGYRRITAHWVMCAKREETRLRRLGVLIDHSSRGLRIPPLQRP